MKFIVIQKNKIIITNIIIYILIFLFLTNSNTCIQSIFESTNIFLTKLVPALLPYILLTEIVIGLNITENLTYGFTKIICKLFCIPYSAAPAIVISYLLGYPNAAKHIYKLYEEEKIDLNTVKKLTRFTNNASPAYIIGTIGIAMFSNLRVGLILLISHVLASLTIGISLNSTKNIIHQKNTNSNSFKEISFSFEILLKSLLNSIKTLGIIWGFTVIFSLVPSLILSKLNIPDYIYGLTIGIFELSNGISILSSINIPLTLKLCLISFVLSFSSLMVILQIYSFIFKSGVKLGYIIRYKILQGLISCIITYILTKLLLTNNTSLVFSNFDNYFETSPIPYYIYLIIAGVTSVLLFILTKKKR